MQTKSDLMRPIVQQDVTTRVPVGAWVLAVPQKPYVLYGTFGPVARLVFSARRAFLLIEMGHG